MIQEEQSQQIGYMVLQGQKLTAKTLYQSIDLAIKKSIDSYHNRSGRISLSELKKTQNQVRVLGTEDDLEGFNKLCKKYGVRYSVIKDASNTNRNLLLFEAKNEELIQQCLKEFYKDFEREVSLDSMDLEAFLDKKELTIDKKKLRKEKQPSLNEKLDKYIDEASQDGEKQPVRAVPEREGR